MKPKHEIKPVPKAREPFVPKAPPSAAKAAMQGGEIPTAWPCGGRCPPETCQHVGRMLEGEVVDFNPDGGQSGDGTIDVESGGKVLRFYLNSNGKTVLKSAMRRANVNEGSLVGANIAAQFESWADTKAGRSVRTYLIGIAQKEEPQSQ